MQKGDWTAHFPPVTGKYLPAGGEPAYVICFYCAAWLGTDNSAIWQAMAWENSTVILYYLFEPKMQQEEI